MQGISATFGDVSFDGGRGPDRVLHPIVPAAVALALAGSIGVWVLYLRPARLRISLMRHWPGRFRGRQCPATGAAAKPYGEIVIDPSFLAEIDPPRRLETLCAGEPRRRSVLFRCAVPAAEPRRLSAGAFRRRPASRDGPATAKARRSGNRRERAFAAASASRVTRGAGRAGAAFGATERREGGPVAPADNRNFLQKLFGLGLPPAPASASRPAVASAPVAPSGPAVTSRPASTSGVAVASPAPESRGAGRVLLGGGAPFGASAPGSGYDRYTAVYDISARTVYLPDGTRLEAHSGYRRSAGQSPVRERAHARTHAAACL